MKNNQLHRKRDEIKSLKQPLPALAGVGENVALSKQVSGKPSRHSLAFFASNNRAASQAADTTDAPRLAPFTGANRHLDMLKLQHIVSYDGVTLQNKPVWRICKAVANLTESEPRHPMHLHGVAFTHNKLGGHNHA